MKAKKKKSKELYPLSEHKKFTPVYVHHCVGERKPGNRRITTCMLVDKEGDVISKGVAFRASMDNQCSETGRKISLSRAIGALTFISEEDMLRKFDSSGKEEKIHGNLSPVRRPEILDLLKAAEIYDIRPMMHKVIFRPEFFTEEEKYVLSRFTTARKEVAGGKEKRNRKGTGAKEAPKRSGRTGDKYRIQRVGSDNPSAKRETA